MSIRLRLAVVFAVASAMLITMGGWLFVEPAVGLAAGLDRLPARRPADPGRALRPDVGCPARNERPGSGDCIVQVVDGSGQLRGGSADAGSSSLLGAGDLQRARRGRLLVTVPAEGERERVLAAPLAGHPGWVAIAGVSLETMDATLRRVTGGAAGRRGGAGARGGVRCLRAGARALSPVERLRRDVADLSEREDAPGVRVPRTRDEIAALATTMNQLQDSSRRHWPTTRPRMADASRELRTPFAVLSGELSSPHGPPEPRGARPRRRASR